MVKQYYSIRTGKNKNLSRFSLDTLSKLVQDLYNKFKEDGYFQECFGYYCVDSGFIAGTLGENIDAQIFRLLRKENLWPINKYINNYSEDDLFDMIEFLYDHISKPSEKYYHSWDNCGWHYSQFDKSSGQLEFTTKVNEFLAEYGSGFELNKGIILIKEENNLADIYPSLMNFRFSPHNQAEFII